MWSFTNVIILVFEFHQLSITMETAQQAVITPLMSSTLVLTAGCVLTTRQWRSSTSTRWWSRLQSAPPTCCTTAALTCCIHTHPYTCKNTEKKEKKKRTTNTHTNMLKVHSLTIHLHITQMYTPNWWTGTLPNLLSCKIFLFVPLNPISWEPAFPTPFSLFTIVFLFFFFF